MKQKIMRIREKCQQFAKHSRSAQNLCDLLAQKTDGELKKYKIDFEINGCMLCVSPNSCLSLYSKSNLEKLTGETWNKIYNIIKSEKPKSLFTEKHLYQELKPFLEKITASQSPSTPFDYLLKEKVSEVGSPRTSSCRFAKANLIDLKLITDWFNEFNLESGSDWTIPTIDQIEDNKFVLFTDNDNNFIARLSLNLETSERVWIGRLYTAQKFRGQGYLHQVMQFAEDFIIREKSKKLTLGAVSNLTQGRMHKNK